MSKLNISLHFNLVQLVFHIVLLFISLLQKKCIQLLKPYSLFSLFHILKKICWNFVEILVTWICCFLHTFLVYIYYLVIIAKAFDVIFFFSENIIHSNNLETKKVMNFLDVFYFTKEFHVFLNSSRIDLLFSI